MQAIFTQYSTYDNLNRLLRANEGSNWQQEFVYDRWGNRTIHQTNTWGTGINNKDFTVNTANNRLGVPAGQSGAMTYDAAGNLTNDTYTGAGSRVYDADNRMTKAWGGNNQWQEYTYTQRVRRKIDGIETRQIYGMAGELLAEYAPDAAPAIPQKEYGYRNGQLLVTASNLKGYWKFDENTGTTATDSAGNGHIGTLASGAGWGTGQSGWATNLDGVNDYLQVGAQSSLVMTSAASFSSWVYPTGPGSDPTFGGIIVNKEGEYEIARAPNGAIQWAFANNNPGWNWINTGAVAPLNQWTHVAVTYDNGVIKTYLNGNLTHTYNGSGSIGDATPSQNDFRMGGRQAGLQHFQGRIEEVRVYNRALTASEVTSLPSGGLSAPNINWLVGDQLGTPRMVFDKTGSLATTKRHDYLPFGEELYAGMGGRTTALGYTADTTRQKFTSKERDNETGLDYFSARYYASIQGRFTSVDPSRKSQRRGDPQTWNRFSYCLNNPLAYVDTNGKWPTGTHDKILANAFKGLSESKLQSMQNGSKHVDIIGPYPRTMREANAAQHAMTPGFKVRELGETAAREWARNEANRFIDWNMTRAKQTMENIPSSASSFGRDLHFASALYDFGMGAHTIMDNVSPAHRDFQVYDVSAYFSGTIEGLGFDLAVFGLDMLAHAEDESREPTPGEMNEMVDALRLRFKETFGEDAYNQAVPEQDRQQTEERQQERARQKNGQ